MTQALALGPSIHCMVKKHGGALIFDENDNLLEQLNDDGLFLLIAETTKKKEHVRIQNYYGMKSFPNAKTYCNNCCKITPHVYFVSCNHLTNLPCTRMAPPFPSLVSWSLMVTVLQSFLHGRQLFGNTFFQSVPSWPKKTLIK